MEVLFCYAMKRPIYEACAFCDCWYPTYNPGPAQGRPKRSGGAPKVSGGRPPSYGEAVSVNRACLSTAELGPVWMVLGSSSGVPSSSAGENHGGVEGLTIVIANVGDDGARDVRVRQAWHEGLGPLIAEVDELVPESEISLTLDCTADEVNFCSVVIEWRDGQQRRRHGIPLRHLLSGPHLTAI